MTNDDRFEEACQSGDRIGAALLAIEFGEGKASKNGAWSWARAAIGVAEEAGITLQPGTASWPDWRAMRAQLEARPAPIIVTRHAGLVAWLAGRGITGRVYQQVLRGDDVPTAEHEIHERDLVGAIVYGMLPPALYHVCREYWEVDMYIPFAQRGREHTPAQMDEWGARLRQWRTTEVRQ